MSLLLLFSGTPAAPPASGITVASLGTGTGLTSGVHTLSITVPSGTDKLVVCVSGTHGSHTPAVDSVKYGGVDLTLAKAQATTSFGTEIWYLDSPTAATANVVVTWGSGGASDASSGTVTALAVDGAATGGPQATAGSTETSTTHQDTDVTSTTDGAVSIESSCRSFGVTGSPAEGQTERSELSDSGGTGGTGGAAYEILGAAGTYSQDYDWSGSCTAVYAVAVWGEAPVTYTATVTASAGGSAAATASHTAPVYTAAVTATAGGYSGASASHTAPVYTATVTAAAGGAAAAVAGVTNPTYTATVTASAGGAAAAVGATTGIQTTFAPHRRALETGRVRATENGLVWALETGRVHALEGGDS